MKENNNKVVKTFVKEFEVNDPFPFLRKNKEQSPTLDNYRELVCPICGLIHYLSHEEAEMQKANVPFTCNNKECEYTSSYGAYHLPVYTSYKKAEVFLSNGHIIHIRKYRETRFVTNEGRLVSRPYIEKIALNLKTGLSYFLPTVINGKNHRKIFGDVFDTFKREGNGVRLINPTLPFSVFCEDEKDPGIFSYCVAILKSIGFDSIESELRDYDLIYTNTPELYSIVCWNRYKEIPANYREEYISLHKDILNSSDYLKRNMKNKIWKHAKNIITKKIDGGFDAYIKNVSKQLKTPRSINKIFCENAFTIPLYRNMVKKLAIKDVNHQRTLLSIFLGFGLTTEDGLCDGIAFMDLLIEMLSDIKVLFGEERVLSLVRQIKETFASDSSRSFKLFVLRDTLQSYNSLKKYQSKIHGLEGEAGEVHQEDVASFIESFDNSFEQALSFRNWKGLHDELASLSNTVRIVSRDDNALKPFKYNDVERELECDVDDFTFSLPKNGMDLARLGSIFHNCVGNYSSYVHNGECIIVYAKKGEEYRLCIELSKENGEYKANQVKSFYNQIPKGEDAEVAWNWLELFNIPSNNCIDVQRMMNPSAKVDYSYAHVNDLVDDDLPF